MPTSRPRLPHRPTALRYILAGTAVEFGPGPVRPVVVRDSVAVLLTGRYGSLGSDSNAALAARWVLLDTYVGGQEIAP